MQQDLLNTTKKMIHQAWNINYDEKCVYVDAEINYFPKKYDGGNPPIINYTISTITGRKQKRENCSVSFVELVNHFIKCNYEILLKNNKAQK
jgi:hypothetical protein